MKCEDCQFMRAKMPKHITPPTYFIYCAKMHWDTLHEDNVKPDAEICIDFLKNDLPEPKE